MREFSNIEDVLSYIRQALEGDRSKFTVDQVEAMRAPDVLETAKALAFGAANDIGALQRLNPDDFEDRGMFSLALEHGDVLAGQKRETADTMIRLAAAMGTVPSDLDAPDPEPASAEPLLGLARTREMLTELLARIDLISVAEPERFDGTLGDLQQSLAHAMRELPANVLDYRTVDNDDEIPENLAETIRDNQSDPQGRGTRRDPNAR